MLRRLLASLALFFGLSELAARIVFPVPEVVNFDRSSYTVVPVKSGALRQRSRWWWSEPDDAQFVHQTNLYGFRDGDWKLQPKPGGTRIAFVGDSFMQGTGAPGQATIPAVFSRLAAEHAWDVESFNLGVGGSGLREYMALIADAVPVIAPDHIVLSIYMNDFYAIPAGRDLAASALVPRVSNPWMPRLVYIFEQLQGDDELPRRWHEGPPAKPRPIDTMARIDPKLDTLIAEAVDPALIDAIRGGRINPAVADHLARSERALKQEIDPTPPLKSIATYLAAHEIGFWVAYLPSLNQVSDRYLPQQQRLSKPIAARSLTAERFQQHASALLESCRDLGIPCLDLTPAIREEETTGGPTYWAYDGHMQARGYEVVAQELFRWLKGAVRAAEANSADGH